MNVLSRRAVLVVSLLSTSALAYSGGAGNAGRSGKTEGMTCNTCHTGGLAPTVQLVGPATLTVGQRATYALTLKGGAAVQSGVNVALSNTLAALEPGAGLEKAGAELVHSAPKAFAGGEVRFEFELVAANAGALTLFAAGLSANGNAMETGDRSEATRLDVTVNAAQADSGDGPQNDPGADSGCAAAGGGPVLALGLVALGLGRRGRRQSRGVA